MILMVVMLMMHRTLRLQWARTAAMRRCRTRAYAALSVPNSAAQLITCVSVQCGALWNLAAYRPNSAAMGRAEVWKVALVALKTHAETHKGIKEKGCGFVRSIASNPENKAPLEMSGDWKALTQFFT